MSAQVSISAKVPEELSRQVDRLAAATHRNRSWVVEEALRAYLAQELAFIEAVEEGLRQQEAGEVVPHAEVVAYVRLRRAPESDVNPG
ncbi:MAG TPA: CopG family ribbon-helix-helix protein [Chloroflexia bacterium]|nr:CopG family ribbon-helix-helix protein [Chloroflexia bacterium]